jgi:predicted RNase H-like nuclease (RuvC/YqgF family)|eukprot:COSAG01_NODE_702_length_14141_cov_36.742739_5_plen_185_part_00
MGTPYLMGAGTEQTAEDDAHDSWFQRERLRLLAECRASAEEASSLRAKLSEADSAVGQLEGQKEQLQVESRRAEEAARDREAALAEEVAKLRSRLLRDDGGGGEEEADHEELERRCAALEAQLLLSGGMGTLEAASAQRGALAQVTVGVGQLRDRLALSSTHRHTLEGSRVGRQPGQVCTHAAK